MNQPVRAFADPLLGIAGPPVEFARPERATLADLIALVPLKHEALRPHLRVKLGGVIIDPSLYHRILPKQNAFVTIVLPVHGGKGGLLGTLAVIALLGASVFVGGGGLAFLGSAFASGATGASLVAGGLSLAASLLLQGLAVKPEGGNSASRDIGVASAQNSFEPGAPLQRVIGTRKVTLQMVAPPFSELDGDDQLVTAVYGLGGPHQIEELKVGTAEIDGAADVEYEIREGFADDTALTLVTDTRVEVPLNLKLSQFRMQSDDEDTNAVDDTISPYEPQWHRVATKIGPDRALMFLTFDGGLIYGSDAGPTPAITAVRVRLRRKGTTDWYNLPELILRGEKQNGALRVQLYFWWLATADMPGSVTAFSTTYGGFSWKYDTVEKLTGTTATYWMADTYFASNKIDWHNKQDVRVYLDTTTFPQDAAYEIEVTRGYSASDVAFTATSATEHEITENGITLYDFWGTYDDAGTLRVPNAQSRFVDSLIAPALQSIWDEAPFDTTGHPAALIAIRARNRSLDAVSCLASGYVEDWDGATWVADQVSSNPASWYREVLRGDGNAEPVADAIIDTENMQDWHEWSADHGWEVNAIVQGQPVTEVLSMIAQSGMARPRFGATYGVVIDRERDPVGLITQRNASGFSFSKPFGRLPHALRVNLADEDADYEVSEVIVYADGYNVDGSGGLIEASRFESITYQGLTNQSLLERRAARDMDFARYRSLLINFTIDIEHLEFQIGDRLLLETDILGQLGGRGRVKEILYDTGLVSGLVLDEDAAFSDTVYLMREDGTPLLREDGTPYLRETVADRGATLRLADGTLRTEEIEIDDNDLTTLTFVTPFAMPTSGGDDLIVVGTLLATGPFETVTRDVLAWDIAPGPDLTAQITAIPYAFADIYGESGFDSGFDDGFGNGA